LAAGLFATIQALEFLFEDDSLGGMRWAVILGLKARNVVFSAVACEFGANWGPRLKD
jgi:hypothetical protein